MKEYFDFININFQKKGACVLINDKYEINFNIINNKDIILSLKITNTFYFRKQDNIYNKNIFFKYIIRIIDFHIYIEGQKMLSIESNIDDNTFKSIKIKSHIDAETIWDYKEKINKNIKLYDTLFRKRGYWYEPYKFYLDYNFDILIKIDDDISFIDIDRFPEYISFIKNIKKNLTIPNLVNHALSLFYNMKEGLIPNYLIKEIYKNSVSPLDMFDYYKDGKEAQKIHKYFLENIKKFTDNDMKPIKLKDQKPSICMFGITKESFNLIYNPKVIWPNSLIPKDYKFQDEKYIYKVSNNYLYPRLVCIHYAFAPQRRNGLDENFLDNYKNISKEHIFK